MKVNKIKQALKEGKTVYGPFCKISDPTMVELAALAGFDFIIIDMEHGPISVESAQNMVRTAEARGIIPVVRVTENNETLILRTLDIGVRSIQVPQISTKLDAQSVVNATMFHPKGERGMCRYVRAADYTNIDKVDHFGTANEGVISIVHIEGLEGIKNLPEILDTDVDVIFLGPYDLSQSCGVPGQVNHEKVVNKMQEAVTLAKSKGKAVGTFVESVHSAKKWEEIGVQYISYSVDVGLVLNTYKSIISGLKEKELVRV
ncbi:HpcH/HpaI aldolase family protein [Reichenbachiella versicolor]|uniref:HpcH/HpaI aldolase family protein n=1 Tax=Reichenbachiella versicolor TaxID=1821036 RepID=UPI000D6E45EA|nr:aldolase/citrate lyase family protein [Reichenbachiella versicolor]